MNRVAIDLATQRPAEDLAVRSLCLASMPWQPVDTPSLALGTLAAYVAGARPDRLISQEHLYLDWYRLLLDNFGDERAAGIYAAVAETGAYTQVGDLIFASTVLGHPETKLRRFVELLPLDGVTLPELPELIAMSQQFVDDHARRLAAELLPGTVVGFSSTFTQTVPSLALAQRLADLRPDVMTVLGGSNMNLDRGRVLLERFDFLDAVIYGEGEQSLQRLLGTLDSEQPPEPSPGLYVRAGAGQRAAGGFPAFVPMAENPPPEHGPYFDRLAETGLESFVEPRLSFELSRGCWWGEKHHCTFCGLNGDGMAYRRRLKPNVADEIVELVRSYRVMDVIFADNILHPQDITEVFAKLPTDIDLRMHLEVKSNMKRPDLLTLRQHGVWHVQPGIESLARRPLQLMRKGVTPLQNVRFLRDAEELGVTCSWNIIVGFPGETREDYAEMLQQLPLLRHLQPPGGVGPLALVRYSPLFDDPSLGYPNRRPTEYNGLIWTGLTPAQVETMSEVFDKGDQPAEAAAFVQEMRELAATWETDHGGEFLYEKPGPDGLQLIRTSRGNSMILCTVDQPWQRELWEGLRAGRTRSGVTRLLAGVPAQFAEAASIALRDWLADGLLYTDDGGLVTLPARYEDHVPYRLGAR